MNWGFGDKRGCMTNQKSIIVEIRDDRDLGYISSSKDEDKQIHLKYDLELEMSRLFMYRFQDKIKAKITGL